MQGKNHVVFRQNKDDWETPPEFFKALNTEFNFTLDPCADDFNFKCKKYYTKLDNGLKKEWIGETVYINPPYSQIKYWVKECARQAVIHNIRIVLLMPSRTDTRYFHEYIYDRMLNKPRPWVKEIRFLKGRLKFVGANYSAPFPSMLVIF